MIFLNRQSKAVCTNQSENSRRSRYTLTHGSHVNYVHSNPLKHGLVRTVRDWPYSTFHRLVATGVYPADWADDRDALNLQYED